MNASMDETRPRGRPPLLALSVIVGTMLIIPAFLYSVAPEEPLKAGVLVFASGKQRAYLTQPARYDDLGYSGGPRTISMKLFGDSAGEVRRPRL